MCLNSFSAPFAWVEGGFKVRIAQFKVSLRLHAGFAFFPFVFPGGICQQLSSGVWLSSKGEVLRGNMELMGLPECQKSLNKLVAFGILWFSDCDLRTSRYCFWTENASLRTRDQACLFSLCLGIPVVTARTCPWWVLDKLSCQADQLEGYSGESFLPTDIFFSSILSNDFHIVDTHLLPAELSPLLRRQMKYPHDCPRLRCRMFPSPKKVTYFPSNATFPRGDPLSECVFTWAARIKYHCLGGLNNRN